MRSWVRRVDQDAVTAPAAEPFGEIGEECGDAVLYAGQVLEHRQMHGGAMRLLS
jgi:hypothetical protein